MDKDKQDQNEQGDRAQKEEKDPIKGLKLSKKTVEGKERIVVEDTCSIYYQNDKGEVVSDLKENSPCCGVLALIKEIETIKDIESEPDEGSDSSDDDD